MSQKIDPASAAGFQGAGKQPPPATGLQGVTEQLTPVGRNIEHESFAIIDREAGPHDYRPDQWPLVRRLIHASGDFDFNGLTAFHPDAVTAGVANLRAGRPIVADVEMIAVGLSRPRLAHFGVAVHHFIADADVIRQAQVENSTRAVQAMRKAWRLGLLDGGLIAIGNAPTALLEVIRLIREEGVRPGLIIGMPVGFVAAAESKAALEGLTVSSPPSPLAGEGRGEGDQPGPASIPWVLTRGRKGGSTLVVAALHALLALAETRGQGE